MQKLTIQRVPFSKDADNKLRSLKARTGITPNILCRMGFCLSLENPTPPEEVDLSDKGREINRYTLVGEYDDMFTALLITWANKHKVDSDLNSLFVTHMNRGVGMLQRTNLI